MRTEHIDRDGWWGISRACPRRTLDGPASRTRRTIAFSCPIRRARSSRGWAARASYFPDRPALRPNRLLDKTMHEISKQLAESGIKPARPHDLRRTFATIAAALNCSTELINRIQNHLPADVGSKHYNKYDYAKEKAKAMEAVAGRIATLVEGSARSNVIAGRFG